MASIEAAASLNNNGSQPVIFNTAASGEAIPSNVTQVGIDVSLTGGDFDLFDGAKGYMYYLLDDNTYGFDMPIEFKKTADGVVGFSISSVDPKTLGGFVRGSINVAVTVPDSTGAPINFANLAFNVTYTYYQLQNDVAYTTYPFATVARPDNARLLAYRFRA